METHETPYSVSLVRRGVGIDWMRHFLPAQRSASVRVDVDRVREDTPTAMQVRREGQATDDRPLISVPLG